MKIRRSISQQKMRQLITGTVIVHGTNGVDNQGTIAVERLSLPRRVQRATKRLGILWLLALLSIPIPGIHFILVPGFCIAGLVMFALTLREGVRIHGGEVECPRCGKSYAVQGQAYRQPLELSCPSCGQFVWVGELPADGT